MCKFNKTTIINFTGKKPDNDLTSLMKSNSKAI